MKRIIRYFKQRNQQRRRERERAAIAKMATPAVYRKDDFGDTHNVRIGVMSKYEKC